MASYQGHLMFSTALGAAYGGAAAWFVDMNWGPVFVGAGMTAIGGLLPDLDSDSGVPVRELFGLGAVVAPLMVMHRLVGQGFSLEQMVAIMGGVYLIVRYGLSRVFRKITVHRGIFHSIPAMLIAGLIVFHAYETPNLFLRLYVTGGVMLGFLSHLVLDEFCAVDFNGLAIKVNQFAGSALKFTSKSKLVTLATYCVLAALAYTAYVQVAHPGASEQSFQDMVLSINAPKQ